MTETVLITGASGGIGEALATLFAKDRSRLLLAARSGGRLEQLGAELSQQFGVEVHSFPVDLSSADGVESLYAQIKRKGFHVDVLINNAGFGLNGAAIKLERDAQLNIIDLNIRALTDLTLRFVPDMVVRGRGGVMQIGSIAGLLPGPFMAVYYASKAYVDSFSQGLAQELKGTGVYITCIMPGVTTTGFADRAGMGSVMERTPYVQSAEDVAEEAYKAFRKGRMTLITGAPNRAMGALVKFLPDVAKRAIIARVHGKGHKLK